ncbi:MULTISPECIES: hypothetical protein [unclassified Microbacterium]|uniref:hypothetical protein n=1 Tax=unclassified Microbacterium TaxID=2609290 RepID=UPI001D92C9EC|nr:hypothetical protein [Microbacterium sp. Bi121]CAH0133227.1 hypothetical protein SRABI121_00823 [Microbacterium sp. Bi121]
MTDHADLDGRTSDAVRAILELEEESPDSLFEVLPGATVPFWAHVRVQIAWALGERQTGSVSVASESTWTRWGEFRRVVRGHLPSRWDAVRHGRAHDVCFYVSGTTLTVAGDRARNWLVDDFAFVTPGAVVVQKKPLPAPAGAPLFRPTLSMEPATARARWRERGAMLPTGFADGVRRLLREYASRLGVEADAFDDIGTRALRTERLRPFEMDELRRMLDRMRPRLVVFDNGSYSYHGETVGAMKDAGAYVVEPQHGWIGPSHAAYNYGRAFQEPSLRRALPDEVLTFGDYWTDSIRHPGRVTTIGKPHLERQAALAEAERPRRILVISSRTDPSATDGFVADLHAAVGGDWAIAFRPHPGERAETARRYPRIASTPGIAVDVEPDVYESLKHAAVVIGEASTVLFEARAFGCTVIARDSAFAQNVIGDAFGVRVVDVPGVAARLADIEHGGRFVATADPAIWAPDAVAAYAQWLERRVADDDAHATRTRPR